MKTLFASAAVLVAATGVATAADVDVAVWDSNNDGYVDSTEYNAGMAAENVQVVPMSLEEIQDWIRVNNPELVVTGEDTDKNGKMEKSEVAVQGNASVASSGQTVVVQDNTGPDFMAFDTDHDGRLDKAEFENWQKFAVKVGIFLDKK